jgi:hypothetical protein
LTDNGIEADAKSFKNIGKPKHKTEGEGEEETPTD